MKMNKHEKEKLVDTHVSDSALKQDEVMDIWEAMLFDFEIVDEPAGLKEEVLQFVFDQEQPERNRTNIAKVFVTYMKQQFTPLTASLCAAMLFCILLLVFPAQEQSAGVNEIATSMKLHAADEDVKDANGYAFIVNKNGTEELIIHVAGFPEVQGQQVYQVWAIYNGQRQSAGIFKPDTAGFGILTINTSDLDKFDTIGITLEPDASSTQPRGKKIVGTG